MKINKINMVKNSRENVLIIQIVNLNFVVMNNIDASIQFKH